MIEDGEIMLLYNNSSLVVMFCNGYIYLILTFGSAFCLCFFNVWQSFMEFVWIMHVNVMYYSTIHL